MMKRLLTLLIGSVSLASVVHAQDPELSQFYASPMYTNPALAGSAVCDYQAAGRAAINYRNQWPGLPGTFRSFAASWDQHIPVIGGGLGAMVFRDVAGSGLLKTTSVSGIYSYLLSMNRDRLFMRFGMQATFTQKSLDFNKLKFADQILPTQGFVLQTSEPLPNQNVSFANFAAGWVLYTAKFYLGFAAHNIIEPTQSFYGNPDEVIPRRYTVHTGAVLPLSKSRFKAESTISPNMLFMVQRNFSQMNLGFYLSKGPLVSGLWFRQTFGQYGNPDAIILLIGFRKDRFKFGYSYDFTVSDGQPAIPSSHEISATIDWCVPPGTKPFRPLRCPQF